MSTFILTRWVPIALLVVSSHWSAADARNTRQLYPLDSPSKPAAEQAKRQAVTAQTRLATTCISQAVLLHPLLVPLFRSGRIDQLIAGIGNACAPEIRSLVDKYDEVYGPGRGREFLFGAYLSDLPRAVAEQIKNEVLKRDY